MLLLNCDVVHKVMRTDTVYDMMSETRRSDPGNFRDNFQKKVLGITVLTGYNNKTYRIDDVDYTKTPLSTFMRNESEVTIAAYYAEVISIFLHFHARCGHWINYEFYILFQRYNITIRDKNQPLLITKAKEKSIRGGAEKAAWLVPELCRITGLSERQRTDIQ